MLVRQRGKAPRAVPLRAAKPVEWRTINGRKVPIRQQQDFEKNRRQDHALEDNRLTK